MELCEAGSASKPVDREMMHYPLPTYSLFRDIEDKEISYRRLVQKTINVEG